METVCAIELRNITKRFGSVVANDGINLALNRGEILSLLGENGSGKTTLMNMLAGIYFPDEGEILVEGKPVSIRSPKDSFQYGIGMIHQHYKLVDVFTAAENIVLGLEGKGAFDLRAAARRVKEISEKYGFDIDPGKKVYDMSVSEKQTVEIIKVLYRGADILILDEPTNHLDMESITALNNGLIKFPGVALFSCHDHQFVQTTANRIIEILPNGSLVDKITTYDEYLASDEMARKRTVFTAQTEDDEN